MSKCVGGRIDSEETATRALAALGDERFGTGFYRYETISGGTRLRSGAAFPTARHTR